MKSLFKEILFEKGFIVADGKPDDQHAYEVVYSLAMLFGIRIISGDRLAQKEMLRFVSRQVGVNVPEPFYRGFPKSVRSLSTDQRLFDQFFHYLMTYGLQRFGEAGHSLFETLLARTAFREKTDPKEYTIITEEEASAKIANIVRNLLLSTRPLNDRQYETVLQSIRTNGVNFQRCASKNTAVRLLADTRNLELTRFLAMSDVIKLTDEINYRVYGNKNLRKLNLRNQDRKFLAAVIDRLFDARRCDTAACCEKKALWCGLLHHIHYQPKGELAANFVALMRGKENISVYSAFEKAVSERNIPQAAALLRDGKGPAAVLRSLDYLISRCASPEEIEAVLEVVDDGSVIVLVQLLMRYADTANGKGARDFRFTKYNKLKAHHETLREWQHRKSYIPDGASAVISARIREALKKKLRGRLGKVYIDPAMRSIALPLQENTSQGGPGVLPKGSRLPIPSGKKLRAFTYWEKVNDIDLSVIGLDERGWQTEFSWRTMAGKQSDAVTYSGDQTSGYNGGSEYFDIDLDRFRQLYPGIRMLIFCDNVYSQLNFDKLFCRAGYMLRDTDDSGEVYEPKTVRSAFQINCASTFAYLFGLDLDTNEFVWLNVARESRARVAGSTPLAFLRKYFYAASVINMYDFFDMMASARVEDPAKADVIVSDQSVHHAESAEVIRSCDFDRVLALMNQ